MAVLPLKNKKSSMMNIDENERAVDGPIQTIYSKKSRENVTAPDEDKNFEAAPSSSLLGVRKMREELKQIFQEDHPAGYQQDMITPIDEMQIREHDFRHGGNQKQLKPLDAGQGASGRVVIQQILNQIHQEFDQN